MSDRILGSVVAINESKAMVAVSTDQGYSILEVQHEAPEIGDELSWLDENPLGFDMCRNETNDRSLEVFFQNHEVHQSALVQQLLIERGDVVAAIKVLGFGTHLRPVN